MHLKVDHEWLLQHQPENQFSAFYEPDIGNQLTAKVTFCSGEGYCNFKLM